jgi:diketogulonate reductase-like aldo/keto reductase
MKCETLRGIQIPKIGFGTWRIGGQAAPDPALELPSRMALRSALELGYTHFDTAEYYAGGYAEQLLGETIMEMRVDRGGLFITSKVSPSHLHYDDVLHACEKSLERLGMEYIDLYLIHWLNPRIPLTETFEALNRLVRENKVKHLGVSNFKLKSLREALSLSETPLFTNQVPYSLPEKTYVRNGVLEFCQQNEILFTAYTPVKWRNLKVNKVIKSIAMAHNCTPFQVALTWLVSQPRVITIPSSLDPVHQAENLAAAEILLEESEISVLNGLYNR